MAKRAKKTSNNCGPPINVLETMAAEIAEAVDLMRPHFPNNDDMSLRRRAEALRQRRYHEGHWPDFAALAAEEAAEAAKAGEEAAKAAEAEIEAAKAAALIGCTSTIEMESKDD